MANYSTKALLTPRQIHRIRLAVERGDMTHPGTVKRLLRHIETLECITSSLKSWNDLIGKNAEKSAEDAMYRICRT